MPIAPVSYASGGNALLRATIIELAWLWVRYQPDGAFSRWFRERAGKPPDESGGS